MLWKTGYFMHFWWEQNSASGKQYGVPLLKLTFNYHIIGKDSIFDKNLTRLL